MIQCRLCGNYYEQITTSHLKLWHGISYVEYLRQAPGAPLIDPELAEVRSLKAEGSAREVWNSYSLEERKERLGNGIRSEAARESLREGWRKLSEEEKERRLRHSFLSEEAMVLSREGSQVSWDRLTLEEKRERLEKSIHSEAAREAHLKVCDTPEYLEKLSKRMEDQWRRLGYWENLSGENHYNWKGGFRGKYGWGWKDVAFFIKIRDNWTCQLCGTKNNLRVHHIDYDTDNWDDSNLITLCGSCNPRANGNRDYWMDYFEKLMVGRALEGEEVNSYL